MAIGQSVTESRYCASTAYTGIVVRIRANNIPRALIASPLSFIIMIGGNMLALLGFAGFSSSCLLQVIVNNL